MINLELTTEEAIHIIIGIDTSIKNIEMFPENSKFRKNISGLNKILERLRFAIEEENTKQ